MSRQQRRQQDRQQQKAKRRLRKQGVADRYSVDPRTVDRMKNDGRIPPPKYYPGSRTPFWFEEELDQADRAATLKPGDANPAGFAQLLAEVSAAATSGKAKDIILAASLKGDLRSLNEVQLEALQDAIHEK